MRNTGGQIGERRNIDLFVWGDSDKRAGVGEGGEVSGVVGTSQGGEGFVGAIEDKGCRAIQVSGGSADDGRGRLTETSCKGGGTF